jgi:hypothetical protein
MGGQGTVIDVAYINSLLEAKRGLRWYRRELWVGIQVGREPRPGLRFTVPKHHNPTEN